MAGLKAMQDLVIAYRFSFDFSWKPRDDEVSGLIQPEAIHYFTDDWLGRNFQILKRVKAVAVPWQSMAKILRALDRCNLEQLEIETFELHYRHRVDYKFDRLKLLSVDALKFYDDNDNPVNDSSACLTITSDRLKTVFLGSDSISYFNFTKPNTITSLTIGRDPKRRITKFKNLTTLRCNRVEFLNIHDVLVLIQSGSLAHFFCNTHILDSTSYQPSTDELRFFANLHQQLRIRSLYGFLTVYFNNVPLSLEKAIEEHHFERNLVNCHYFNYLGNGELAVIPCESVTRIEYTDLLDTTYGLKRRVEQRLAILFELYSNVRICVLDNSLGQRSIEPEPFFQFLSRCNALAELKICNAGFPAKWYNDHLTSEKLNCLKNLNKFVLNESVGFAGCLTFDFLQHFKHLLRFSTNLATRQTMVELVRLMPVWGTYGFQFINPLECSLYDLVVQRTSSAEATLYIRKRDPDFDGKLIVQQVMLFDQAVKYLANQTHLYCGHWMEELPPVKPKAHP